ncbi:MAG: hypothetical protein JOZ86_13745 [Candidatus Eremiobacteraeota bacterium]|nr:hypothetical protein [Candidatus Eremiobacteraeota bacterium]
MNRTLSFYNNSAKDGFLVISQFAPVEGEPVFVWLTKYANPGGRVQFTWTNDYAFVWSDTGTLVPGVVVTTGQLLPTTLHGQNMVTFVYDAAVESFKFVDQGDGQGGGRFFIRCNETIVPGMASVGLAQSGAPVRLMPANPQMTYVFEPPMNTYFVGFGQGAERPYVVANTFAPFEKIDWQMNIAKMDATLNADGSWKIEPTHLLAE